MLASCPIVLRHIQDRHDDFAACATAMSLNATWTKLSQHDQLKRSSVCATAVNSTIYIFGGELEARKPRDNHVHKLNLNARQADFQTLTAGENAPTARVGAATTSLNGKVYMFSGRGGEAMAPVDEQGSLWVWDPSTESWDSLKPSSSTIPEPRSYHCMASDGQDTLYVHAGCPEKGRLSDLWAFSVSKSQWTQLTSAPGPARGGASIAYADGKLYRMNGFDGQTEQGGSLDVFDPAENSWSTIDFKPDGKAGPGARSVAILLPVRSKGETHLVTLFGECDPSSLGHLGAGNMLSDGWAYTLNDGTWSQITAGSRQSPDGRGWFDADVVTVDGQDSIAVVGGLGESNDRLDDAWLLSFA